MHRERKSGSLNSSRGAKGTIATKNPGKETRRVEQEPW